MYVVVLLLKVWTQANEPAALPVQSGYQKCNAFASRPRSENDADIGMIGSPYLVFRDTFLDIMFSSTSGQRISKYEVYIILISVVLKVQAISDVAPCFLPSYSAQSSKHCLVPIDTA
jgi:hypothetical protein